MSKSSRWPFCVPCILLRPSCICNLRCAIWNQAKRGAGQRRELPCHSTFTIRTSHFPRFGTRHSTFPWACHLMTLDPLKICNSADGTMRSVAPTSAANSNSPWTASGPPGSRRMWRFGGNLACQPTRRSRGNVSASRLLQNPSSGRARLLPSRRLSRDSEAPRERRPAIAGNVKLASPFDIPPSDSP